MNIRTRRAGTPTGRLQSRLGSGARAGAGESIYESGNQESRETENETDIADIVNQNLSALCRAPDFTPAFVAPNTSKTISRLVFVPN